MVKLNWGGNQDYSKEAAPSQRKQLVKTGFCSLVLSQICLQIFLIYIYFKDLISFLLERGEGREIERERNINVWLPLTHPSLGTWPTTQACALTGN